MPAKILLGCGSLLVFAVIGVAILIFVLANGAEFGKTIDQDGCMTEGYRRTRGKPMTEIFNVNDSAFVEGCLRTARKIPNFCKGVPGPLSDRTEWQSRECETARVGNQTLSCICITQAKQAYCNYVE
jgi:hypothetical protein